MLNLFSREAKASPGLLAALQYGAGPLWSARDMTGLMRSYETNAIVHRCVRLIAETAGSVSFECGLRGARALIDAAAGQTLFEQHYSHLLLAGNAYFELVSLDGSPREITLLRPDRMRVLPGPKGWPEGWEYAAGGKTVRHVRDRASGRSPILHRRLFHPSDDHYGLSPLRPAAAAVDLHQAGADWAKALLDNSARPSGALVFSGGEGARLSADQFDRLKSELSEAHAGARNAGRPLLLEGGLDWKPMALSPAEMDFIEARREAAREIALALGVPPLLLGLPGDNTYANYREANLAFIRQTVRPLVRRTASALEAWLRPWFEPGLSIRPEPAALAALTEAGE